MEQIKYRWISDNGPNSCKACAEHAGKVFDSLDDVPELPVHPNCKCVIELVIGGVSPSELADQLIDELQNLENALLEKKRRVFCKNK